MYPSFYGKRITSSKKCSGLKIEAYINDQISSFLIVLNIKKYACNIIFNTRLALVSMTPDIFCKLIYCNKPSELNGVISIKNKLNIYISYFVYTHSATSEMTACYCELEFYT